MREKAKEETGITLIALIITIILMLILAGVAMSMLSTNNGIFTKTKESVGKYNNSVSDEAQTIDDLMGALMEVQTVDSVITPTTATQEAKLRLSTTEGYTTQYKMGEDDDWTEYTTEIPITANGYVYTSLKDEKGRTSSTRTINISNIDRVKPNEFSLEVEHPTKDSIKVIGITEDTASEGARTGIAGIKEYKYKLSDNEGNVIVDWSNENNFAGLTHGESYKVSMKAIDYAENEKLASNNDKTTKAGVETMSELIKNDKIKVGDVVDYQIGTGTGTTNGEYTITKAQSGYTADQTYSVEKYTGGWKVLHIDKTACSVEIVSDYNILSGNTSRSAIFSKPWRTKKI